MPRFAAAHGINLSQAEIDFVDIDSATDTELYIDPYAIQIRNDEWSADCGDLVRSFFSALLTALKDNDIARATHLLSHLHEPNETLLGQSRGTPAGKGVGSLKSDLLVEALSKSTAFKTGVLSDISEAELFIPGIGPDTVSDLTTNIIRQKLVTYTQQQCDLYGITTRQTSALGPRWDINSEDWISEPLHLPTLNSSPVILVPKFSVRRQISLNSQEFYNHFMIEFLKSEYERGTSAIVQVLKNGRRRVNKKDVKARHPFAKDALAQFALQHPDVLAEYKKIKGAQGPLEPDELEENFDEREFARILTKRLTSLPTGGDTATQYHQLAAGICTFLFYPALITPTLEHRIHEGRKRIDIKFTNASTDGFFFRVLEAAQTRAIQVFLECKNYSKDITNPELDQMAGRFGLSRGYFGIILCRTLTDEAAFTARCRDTALDGRGFIIHLTDSDLTQMLAAVANATRSRINTILQQKLDALLN